jgi:hypothetical protein
MRKAWLLGCLLGILILSATSCNKFRHYFRNPDSDLLVETIHSTTLTGYAISTAMAVMNGYNPDNVISFTRNLPTYPCATLMVIDLEHASGYPYFIDKASSIIVAGLWSDHNTAVFSLIYTDYHAYSQTIDLVGIQTVPAILDGNSIEIALATQDIQLNPDEDALLSINLNTLEVASELFRLDMPRPTDVYVAVEQSAYFIDVNNNGTLGNMADDRYNITGGGQLIEIETGSTEVIQQAMIDVRVTPACYLSPVSGMSLLQVIDIDDHDLPELGTALLQFNDHCAGSADVYVATGIYIGANGKSIPFEL